MGYGISGRNLKNDEDCIFYTSCMYAYQPVFRECFGKEITEFSGRITKAKLNEFVVGVSKLNNSKYNLNRKQMAGYFDNITHDQLIADLQELCNLMINKKVKYLDIL